jgi:hypothetical protein
VWDSRLEFVPELDLCNGEIQGNVVRDPACLNRVETLPWDD